MGNIQSNVTKQTLADYTNVVNSTVAKVFNNAAAQCASGNTFTLQTGGQDCTFEMRNGTINVFQTAGTNCKLDNQNITDLTADFQTQITNNTKQFIEENSKNKQGWFATAFSLQIQGASNIEQVMTQITNETKIDFTNMCSSVATALNYAKVILCGYFDATTINFTQNALVSSLTSCVNHNTINIWTSNAILNNLWQSTDQKLASEQAGLNFTWVFIISSIISVILLLIIGVGVYFYIKQK